MKHLFVFVFLYTALSTPVAHAQALPIPGIAQNPTIVLSPQYPAPFELVTATVHIPNEELSSADIAWILDGTPADEGPGHSSYTFRVGDVGQTQTLSVIVRTPNGTPEATQARINPARISIAWEAQTYTPPLYKGRALYTAGSFIRVEAQVFFKDSTGIVPQEQLVYSWRRNGSALVSANGLGKNIAYIEGPKFYGDDIITVQVSTINGSVVGTGAVSIETTDARAVLYTWSPVTGVQYNRAISTTEGAVGTATTVVAEPYFMSALSAESPLLIYKWLVNGRTIKTNTDTPNILSLSSEDAVSATVALSITHQTALLQEAKKRWQLQFKEAGFGIFGR